VLNKIFRWLSGLDRSYVFALSALVAALFATVALTGMLTTRSDSDQATKILGLILVVLPLFIAGTPLIALPQRPGPRYRNDKVNSIAATAILAVYSGLLFSPIGVFYLPALVFSASSSVSLFFGRKKYAVAAEVAKDIRVASALPRLSSDEATEGRRRKKRNRNK
jgi:FtsH-binding integral membrane protein